MRTVLVCLAVVAVAPRPAMAQVKPGLEVLLGDSIRVLQGKRVGLITNHTGLDRQGRRNVDLIFRAPGARLVALFGPEHGFGGAVRGGDKIGFATSTGGGAWERGRAPRALASRDDRVSADHAAVSAVRVTPTET